MKNSNDKSENLKLFHELEVHQIELELQNDELILARERAIKDADKFIELYDFAPSGYFTIDSDGKIVELNLAGANMLGKERKFLINSNFCLFVAKDNRSVFKEFIKNSYESNTIQNCVVIIVTIGKLPTYFFLTGIVQENQKLVNITATDITAQKLAEHELIKAKEHAEESDRLKSAFLANISHEIRTPLNGILGFAEILKDQNLSEEEIREYIYIIEKGGKRMLNIINDLINISKIEANLMEIHLTDININEQIEYIYSFFEHEAKNKGLVLSYKNALPSNESWINSDSEKIYAVLTNLVNNALKFTKEGSIEIGYNLINPVEKDNEPAKLEFFIKDTGIGIKKDQQELIFERFRQGSESLTRIFEGTGLGLSISKAFVEMLGGKIWVKSEEGKGSEFYFTVPFNAVKEDEKRIMSVYAEELEENRIKTTKILIAEDEEISDSLITIALKKIGPQFLHAKTGVQTVEICKNNPDIDMILMDIKMPEMDGYEATRQIRKFNKDVIIIAQTAYGLLGDREKSIAAGCNDYISKPINLAKFTAMIKKYINEI